MGALADRIAKDKGRTCKFGQIISKMDATDKALVDEWHESYLKQPRSHGVPYHHSALRLAQLLLDVKIPVGHLTIKKHFEGRCRCYGQTH